MQRFVTLVFIVLAVVLGIGWYREYRHHNAPPVATLPALRTQTPVSHPELRPADGARVVAMPMQPATMHSLGPTRGPTRGEPHRAMAMQIEQLDAAFADDGTDPAWARQTELALANAAAAPVLSPFAPPAQADARCGRTMCRMVFAFANRLEAEDWVSFYPPVVGSALPRMQSVQVQRPDGTVEVRMYAYRSAGR